MELQLEQSQSCVISQKRNCKASEAKDEEEHHFGDSLDKINYLKVEYGCGKAKGIDYTIKEVSHSILERTIEEESLCMP